MIIIYSLEGCPYSQASEKLVALKLQPSEYQIEKVSQNEKEDYKEKNNHPTFPQVFNNGELLGGYTELKDYLTK